MFWLGPDVRWPSAEFLRGLSQGRHFDFLLDSLPASDPQPNPWRSGACGFTKDQRLLHERFCQPCYTIGECEPGYITLYLLGVCVFLLLTFAVCYISMRVWWCALAARGGSGGSSYSALRLLFHPCSHSRMSLHKLFIKICRAVPFWSAPQLCVLAA